MVFRKNLRTNPVARSLREFIIGISSLSDSPFKSITHSIEVTNVSKVLDIGANVGQFGLDIRRYGFKGQIISFEPVKEFFEILSNTTKKHKPWSAINIGLGATESVQYINISGNSGLSSSLLTMGKIHLNNFPKSATVSTQKVLVSTIDNQLEVLGIDPGKILLKLDVQGFEAEVLKGAAKSLSKIPLCFLEVSIVPLYEGEIVLLPILNLLSESGHEVVDIFRGLKTKNGQLLQLDILTKLTVKKPN
jgi:FkbM family methyltransferase